VSLLMRNKDPMVIREAPMNPPAFHIKQKEKMRVNAPVRPFQKGS